MKNLATIQKILEVNKHPNADSLDIVRVLGWDVIVKIGEFKLGDLCVYIGIDNIVPEKPEFEFLRNKKFKVKSIKLRGRLSQGLCLPTFILGGGDWSEGQDITEMMGITHYEKPIPAQLSGEVRGNFPSHLISKTNEERIQNVPELIDFMRGKDVYVSTKSDGSSGTYIHEIDGTKRVCSRNMDLKENSNNTFWKVAKQRGVFEKLPKGTIIQAENIGEGIQKNREQIKGHDIRVFNVFDLKSRRFLDAQEMIDFCAERDFPTVDLYYMGPFKWGGLQEMLDEADKVMYKSGQKAEGLVWRLAKNEYCSRLGKDFSVKTISNKFALKNGE